MGILVTDLDGRSLVVHLLRQGGTGARSLQSVSVSSGVTPGRPQAGCKMHGRSEEEHGKGACGCGHTCVDFVS